MKPKSEARKLVREPLQWPGGERPRPKPGKRRTEKAGRRGSILIRRDGNR